MECSRLKGLIQDEIDGLIAPSDRRALDEHLASCPRCRAERDAFLVLDRALDETLTVPAPAWMTETVMNRIAHERSARRVAESWAVGVAAATAGTAVVVSVVRLVGPEGLRTFRDAIGRAAEATVGFFSPLAPEMPGLEITSLSEPGILGVLWALAAAGAAVLAISALQAIRELAGEWR